MDRGTTAAIIVTIIFTVILGALIFYVATDNNRSQGKAIGGLVVDKYMSGRHHNISYIVVYKKERLYTFSISFKEYSSIEVGNIYSGNE